MLVLRAPRENLLTGGGDRKQLSNGVRLNHLQALGNLPHPRPGEAGNPVGQARDRQKA